MYTDYYGLSFNPFDKQMVKEKDAFESEDFREMTARLEYLKEIRGIGVFTASPGMGKTFGLRCFSKKLNPNLYQCAYLCLSTVSIQEFYRQLCEALGLESGFGKSQMFKSIQERLYYLYKEKRQPFICILDEAQYLNSSILRDLKMLMNQKYDSVNCFSLILCGEPYLNHILEKQVKGYIPISALWKEVSVARLENATKKVMDGVGGQLVEIVPEKEDSLENGKKEEEQSEIRGNDEKESEDMIMSDILNGFEVIDTEVGKSDSVMTVSGNMLKFNKPTAAELMYPAFVRVLIHVPEKKVAIQVCTEKTKCSTPFSKPEDKQSYAISIKNPAIVVAVRKLLPELDPNDPLTFKGQLYLDDKVIIYDLSKGEPIKRRNRRKAADKAGSGEMAQDKNE